MSNSCNHELEETRGGERGRYYLLHEEERILPKYILGLVSVITVISSYLKFKGYSVVPD